MFRIQLNEMRSGVPTYFMLNVNAVAVCIFVVVAVVDIIKRILKQTQKLIHIHKWAVGGGRVKRIDIAASGCIKKQAHTTICDKSLMNSIFVTHSEV